MAQHSEWPTWPGRVLRVKEKKLMVKGKEIYRRQTGYELNTYYFSDDCN